MMYGRRLVRVLGGGLRVVLAAGLAGSLVGACVVSSDDDGDDGGQVCTPGDTQACECTDGEMGSRVCTASGRGYGSCDCDGGAGGSVGAGAGGMASTTGGTTSTGGMPAQGGAAPAGGAAGETSTGGSGEGGGDQGGAGGEGGGGDMTDFITPCNTCASALAACEDEFEACDAAEICSGSGADNGEYGCMLECVQELRRDDEDDFITTTEMATCAAFCESGSGGWSAGLDGTTRDLFDCLAGGEVVPASPWDAPAATNCTAECFGAGS